MTRRPAEKFKIKTVEKFGGDCDSTPKDFTYKNELSFDENMQLYRSFLSDFEKKNFDDDRQRKYWLTFGTCIIYGLIAVILLLFGSFTTYGNYLLFNELYIFIMTYIIGTIIIISILIYKVYSFDFPDVTKKIGSESLYCPDYWDSTIINVINTGRHNNKEGGINKRYFGSDNPNSDFNLECSIKENSGIYNSNSLYNDSQLRNYYNYKMSASDNGKLFVELEEGNSGNTGLSLTNGDYEEFRKIAATLSGYSYDKKNKLLKKNNDNAFKDPATSKYYDESSTSNKIPLICDRVYPLYMAKKDFEYSKAKGLTNYNKFRCAYSKACGIPWTEVGCS
jgi:hypothetical protein